MLAVNIVVKLRTFKCCKRIAGCTITSGIQRDEFKSDVWLTVYRNSSVGKKNQLDVTF